LAVLAQLVRLLMDLFASSLLLAALLVAGRTSYEGMKVAVVARGEKGGSTNGNRPHLMFAGCKYPQKMSE
jgi:hypothetical protein